MNSCKFSGRLTRDPELRHTASGTAVCNFGVAVTRPYVKDKTDFIDCVAWGPTAEFVTKYFAKGKGILVSDSVAQLEQWEKDGAKHSKVSFNVRQVEFLGFEKNSDKSAPAATSNDGDGDGGVTVGNEEDIPF